jgi:hypothetical protein
VILKKCRWDKTALGKLNALPDKAPPLTGFNPRGGGWNAVANGLAKVFRRLMKKANG